MDKTAKKSPCRGEFTIDGWGKGMEGIMGSLRGQAEWTCVQPQSSGTSEKGETEELVSSEIFTANSHRVLPVCQRCAILP